MKYLADTHALIWYFAEDKRLGKNAEQIFLQAEKGKVTIILPTIVLAEAEAIARKYGYQRKFHTLVARLQENPNFIVYPFDEVVLEAYFKTKPTLEIHDRVIVATAKIQKATLITKDREIKRLKGIEIVW